MKKVKCLICIAVFALTVMNPAASFRSREYFVSIAVMGDLVIVGKLLAVEGKMDAQTRVGHTDVIVEVVQVIQNRTEQEVEVGSTINFRPLGGQIGNHRMTIIGEATFDKGEIGNLVLLSLKRPDPRVTTNSRRGFDTIFDVFGGAHGKYTVRIKNNKVPMVHAFWSERRDKEIGLPLDLVLELMNMAIKVVSKNPVKNPKTPEEIPAEVAFKGKRLTSLEQSIRKLASDGLPETAIIPIARAEIARVKQELGL